MEKFKLYLPNEKLILWMFIINNNSRYFKWKISTYPDFVENIFFGCLSSIIKPDITK